MNANPDFDEARAHKYFAAACFNRAWSYIEKPERTPAEEEAMLLAAHASLWHWTEREDCTPQNLSIGYWQLSRVCALAGQAENARRYAERCLAHSQNEPPFYHGYAHEALARAAAVSGDRQLAEEHLAEARRLAAMVDDAKERKTLEQDLDAIG